MERIGDILDGGTPAGEFLLYGYTDALGEILLAVFPLQLFLELRRKHPQNLGIAGDKWSLCVATE
jgi:hypothetical protein